MFEDMEELSVDASEILRVKAMERLTDWLTTGTYLGWLATPFDQPECVVGGAGVQCQSILPRPLGKSRISGGRQAIIINVFVEPQWRRRGIATQLIKEIIGWSKTENVDRLLLHASDAGRLVYAKLGFVEGNEMRFIPTSKSAP